MCKSRPVGILSAGLPFKPVSHAWYLNYYLLMCLVFIPIHHFSQFKLFLSRWLIYPHPILSLSRFCAPVNIDYGRTLVYMNVKTVDNGKPKTRRMTNGKRALNELK